MRRRFIFFAIAAVIAMLLVILINSALRTKQAAIEELQRGQEMIVIATKSLNPGTMIESGSVKLVPWPRQNLPEGAFTSIDQAVGKLVKQPVGENQPLVATALFTGEHPGGLLPLVIPSGMRAMSIPVNEVSDMAGMVLPHTRVDVLVTTAAGQGGIASDRTRIVLQNIEVIATNAELEPSSNRPQEAKVVTLLVTPADAEKLAAAIRLGTLQLAMRGYADQQMVSTPGFDIANLFGAQQRPTVADGHIRPMPAHRPPATVPARSIEIIRNGTERQTVTFIGGRPVALPPASIAPAAAGAPPAPESSASPSAPAGMASPTP